MENEKNEKDLAEKLLAEADVEAKDVLTERRAKLEQAKKEAVDKEPFDIEKLKTLYDLSDDSGKAVLSPERVEKLEMEYYLNQKDAKTLEEFAKRKEDLDSYNAG